MSLFTFTPSVSAGDVLVAVGLVLAGVFAFTDLDKKVAVVETKTISEIAAIQREQVTLREKFYAQVRADAVTRRQDRDEYKSDLKAINDKLDRLIERQAPHP